MSPAPRLADVMPRLISAVVLVAVASLEIWLGGIWFSMLVGVVVAAMLWELQRMIVPGTPTGLPEAQAFTGGVGVVVFTLYLGPIGGPLFLAAALVLMTLKVTRDRAIFAAYAGLVLAAGHALILLRDLAGFGWVVWLICVVVATDVAGYFVGRLVGGPKFWPRVSPKKTWSGTAGGWVAAAGVGVLAMAPLQVGWEIVVLSVLAAMAGQAGDVAESALKRRAGVKDSSRLIPGHGGVMDRFDAMIAVAVFVYLSGRLFGLPLMAPAGV